MSSQKKLSKLENKFNLIVIGMIKHMANYHNDTKVKLISSIAEKIILNKPEEPITCFLIHIYKNDEYRINILNENDSFFMNYDINCIENTNMMKHIFEFKSVWKKIDNETKTYIKRAMRALVLISQKYVLSI
jgi:hypothetical protein